MPIQRGSGVALSRLEDSQQQPAAPDAHQHRRRRRQGLLPTTTTAGRRHGVSQRRALGRGLLNEGRVSVPGVRALKRVHEAALAVRGYPLRAHVRVRPLRPVHLR